MTEIREISGHGVIAKVDGREVAAGNGKLMKQLGIAYRECHSVGTIIHMAVDGAYAGHIVISDVIKPHAREGTGTAEEIRSEEDSYADRRFKKGGGSGRKRAGSG